jgi:hypothetical protein
MNVLRAVAPCTANDDLAILFVPLEDRAGTDAQLLSNLRGHRDLSLCRQPGMSYRHLDTLPR